jgi:hypothetical protein
MTRYTLTEAPVPAFLSLDLSSSPPPAPLPPLLPPLAVFPFFGGIALTDRKSIDCVVKDLSLPLRQNELPSYRQVMNVSSISKRVVLQ